MPYLSIIQQAKVEYVMNNSCMPVFFSSYLPILSSLVIKEHLHHTVIMELKRDTIGFIDCCTMDSQSTLVGKINTTKPAEIHLLQRRFMMEKQLSGISWIQQF